MPQSTSRREFLTMAGSTLVAARLEAQTLTRPALAFVGSRTRGPGFGNGGGGGITTFTLNPRDGTLTQVSRTGMEFDDLNNDGMCVSPDGHFLYAVNQTLALNGRAGAGGGVVAFAIDPASGSLSRINAQPSMGVNPCYAIVDRTGRRLLVANHGAEARIVQVTKRDGVPTIVNPTDDGTVAMFPLNPDGSLEPACDVAVFERRPLTEAGPGAAAHSVNFDRTGRFVIACDVGADHIYVYPFDPASRVLSGRSFATPQGRAPRHSAFHPTAPYFFITNEREPSVSSFHFDSTTGEVRPLETVSSLLPGYSGPRVAPSNIRLHPNGRFLYSANRGDNSLAVFGVDQSTGALSQVEVVKCGGTNPREMNFDPSGRFLFVANVQSNDVVTFAVDGQTGRITATGAKVSVERPGCIYFTPA